MPKFIPKFFRKDNFDVSNPSLPTGSNGQFVGVPVNEPASFTQKQTISFHPETGPAALPTAALAPVDSGTVAPLSNITVPEPKNIAPPPGFTTASASPVPAAVAPVDSDNSVPLSQVQPAESGSSIRLPPVFKPSAEPWTPPEQSVSGVSLTPGSGSEIQQGQTFSVDKTPKIGNPLAATDSTSNSTEVTPEVAIPSGTADTLPPAGLTNFDPNAHDNFPR